jgi:hypothetical protein
MSEEKSGITWRVISLVISILTSVATTYAIVSGAIWVDRFNRSAPVGYAIERNPLGEYRVVQPDGTASRPFDSKREAIRVAWYRSEEAYREAHKDEWRLVIAATNSAAAQRNQ